MDSRGFSPRSFLAFRYNRVWSWCFRRRTSVLFFSRWLRGVAWVGFLHCPVPLVTLEHGVTALSACALGGCMEYFTGLPHAVPVRPSRLSPGSVLCLWPGTRSPSFPFPCFIACNSCVLWDNELQGCDLFLRMRPETVSLSCQLDFSFHFE